ncbi:O-antigen polymerase [Pedobacter cryotolerans]|uniref:Oligosaccharide repeat unit polymerase n=1 Tax=Pedobacter cryotolerans TaxID=2571270 RepID=A0A4U1CBT2_9SPHI|nr:O-antigen polymerase [Pedobacter cryotolerans]TKC03495.1 oligosaccharide repeat unit polymerase [Pedobacter cryotolerans]
MWNRILNPFFVFTAMWLFVIYLINLQLTKNISRLDSPGFQIIYINIVTGLIIYLVFYFIFYKKRVINQSPSALQYKISLKFANRSFYLFLFLTALDIIYSGGVPLIWLFTGSAKSYLNLGIPSIRGFQYTLYLFTFTVFVYLLKFHKFKNWKIKIAILILLPFLMLARGLLIYTILQIFYIYIYDKKISFNQIRNIAIFSIILILIFGVIGDIRGEYANPFAPLITDNPGNPLNNLPSGFTWIYIYITANFNNILLTIGTFQPSYTFIDIFYNLVPGFLKQFFTSSDKASPLITDASLNVASFYAGYVTSFGVVGGIFGGIILQTAGTYYYFKAKTLNIGYLVAYAIIFTCIFLSVFFDAFMTVSSFFGIILSVILANRLKNK